MWQGSLENTNRFKDIRYNSYFHKANPPAHMMTDVMHFGIHDSAFNGLAGRKCSSILRRLHGPGHVTLVILGSLNVASVETAKPWPGFTGYKQQERHGVRSVKEPGIDCIVPASEGACK